MTRNDDLQWFILGFGLSGSDDNLGRPSNISRLWENAQGQGIACDRNEFLVALYTMPWVHAALIKFVSVGEGFHPVSFERVRNTTDWPDYFLGGEFHVKVLPEGKVHYQKHSDELGSAAVSRFG